MSTAIYPTLPGLTFSVKRTPTFQTRVQTAISGKETRYADWSYPRYAYELAYDVLRAAPAYLELQTLQEFYLARQGSFDSFLFNDPDDNSVTGQVLGHGNSSTTTYQCLRDYGANSKWIDVILAPNVVSAIYINGVVQNPATYSVSHWGSNSPGVVTFNSAPLNGTTITADLTFFWPCRFTTDTIDFEKFMNQLWEVKKVAFLSIK